MDELASLREHGVFLRRDALELGWSDRDLTRALAHGVLARIRQGAYVDGRVWLAADDQERHRLMCHATMLVQARSYVASHTSAALLHDLPVWGSDLARVHVIGDDRMSGRRHRHVSYHQGPPLDPVSAVRGTRTVSPAEAAFGTAMVSSVESGVVVLDGAYRAGHCDQEDLRALAAKTEHWPGRARLQITLRIAEPGSESVGESRARVLFARGRVPRPVLQFPVYDGIQLVGTTDFAWPEHGALGEFDGKVKYESLRRPGESPADVLFREKQREDRIREITGWRFIRLTWADLERPRATAVRVRQALGLD